MAPLIYLDTHVVAWLYGTGPDSLTDKVARLLEGSDEIRISPMVRLELQYLFEIGRVGQRPLPVLDALQSTLGLAVCDAPFPAVVRIAESQVWTRDPFDRAIVAQAFLFDAPLVTKDAGIHTNYSRAVWD
jgi:PIN domain nuclease of toxin-antitoxin system